MRRFVIALVFLSGCTQEGTTFPVETVTEIEAVARTVTVSPVQGVRKVTPQPSLAATTATLQVFSGGPSPMMRGSSGVWDPNDVDGRFDFRWVGAAYTAAGDIHLSVSFYDDFRPRLLPRFPHYEESNAGVRLSGALSGYFMRGSGGRIVFIWGDFGSGCCERDVASQPSSQVISVTFDPCDYGYGEEIDLARGESYWARHGVRARDTTGEVALHHPECDFTAA